MTSLLLTREVFFAIFAVLVLHPRSNGTVICVDMDKVWLRVKTVPTSDPVTNEAHTAYTVLRYESGAETLSCASAWTLQDAIERFCKLFRVERHDVKLCRPFLPQEWTDDGDWPETDA